MLNAQLMRVIPRRPFLIDKSKQSYLIDGETEVRRQNYLCKCVVYKYVSLLRSLIS